MTERTPLRDAAQGRWRGILPALGMPAALLNGRHGPCPVCGGKDRFRFDDKEGRGTWFCNVCGAGDGISLVMRMQRVDFRGAAAFIEPLAGVSPAIQMSAERSEADHRRWRNEAWRSASPVRADDPVGIYLQRRVGLAAFPDCLRHHPALEHRDDDGRKSRHPAMLAMVSAPDGRAANIHRTYLSPDGRKAAVEPVRRMMPGSIPNGAAIRLLPAAEEMGVAEGIETAFAAAALFGIPVWATISDRVLAKWTPPPGVRRVVIFGDNDPGFAGQAAAYALARTLAGQRLVETEVRIPDRVSVDWNDILETA